MHCCTSDGRESRDQPHPLMAGGSELPCLFVFTKYVFYIFVPDLLVAPQNVEISAGTRSPSFVIRWSYPVQAVKNSYTPPTHFVILIDAVECCRVEAKQDKDNNNEESISMTVEITDDDISKCGIKLSKECDHLLVVRSLTTSLQSEDSKVITIPSELVSSFMNAQFTATSAVVPSIAQKDNSSSPMDNSVVHVPPVAKPRGMYYSSPSGDVSSSESSDDDDIEIFSPINRSIRESSLSPVVTGALTNGSVKQARIVNDEGICVCLCCVSLCMSVCLCYDCL